MTPPTTTRSAPAVHRLLGLLTVTICCGALLLLPGADQLHVPLTSTAEFLDWLDHTSAPVMAVSALRLAALAACIYLILVLGVILALTAAGRVRAAHRALHLTPLAVRRLVASGVGLGMAAQASLGATPAGAHEAAGQPTDDVAVMIQLDPDEPPTSGAEAEPEIATMEFREPESVAEGPPTTATTASSDHDAGRHSDHSRDHNHGHHPEAENGPEDEPDTPVPDAGNVAGTGSADDRGTGTGRRSPDDGIWVVEPGDSFWTAAERLAAEDGSDDVAAHWYRLIDANRAELADPDNPDLLLPGQELRLPR